MNDENLTNEQLMNELIKLRQKNSSELERALEKKETISKKPVLIPPGRWFATGRSDLFVFERSGRQPKDRRVKYRYSDLVDIPAVQQLLNTFYVATGLPYGLIDVDDSVLSGIGWQDICTNFHRVCPSTRGRCMQSDSYIKEHLHDGSYVGYKCLNGLFDYSVPIIVDGEHLATISVGQLLHEPPDEEYFRRQAREYGFDETSYMEALHRVPVILEEDLGQIMGIYIQLANFLSNLALVRKRQIEAADQILRSREELLGLVLETSNTGFWDWNIETGELYFSPAWIDMLEYTPQDIEPFHKTWERLLHPDDINAARKLIGEHLKGRTAKCEVEYRMLSKSGKWKWILSRGQVVDKNEKGKPLRIAGTSIDITERKLMEEELRLSEESFSKAFNASPLLMTLTTLDNGRIIKANDAFCRIIDCSPEDLIGRTTLELGFWVNPGDRQLLRQSILANRPVREMEIAFCTKTGEQRLGLCYADSLDIYGEACVLAVVLDITTFRNMELEMIRLDRLNLVGELAASIGHEIRNPMTTVRGYLQILREYERYTHEREYFDLMIEELDRANSIISDFLSLAKNKVVEMAPTNLNAIVSKTFPLIQARAVSKDHYIKLELGEIPDLLLDHKEIRQLLLNLINNGLEAMSQPGTVTIKTYTNRDKVVLAVQDQGNGINPELLDKLGTPFLTTKEQGTGLGLAVCYRITAQHNASINFETGSSGTTFFISFPNESLMSVSKITQNI